VASFAAAQNFTIENNVAANPPGGGWYPWYEIHADPENANNLIICGSRWDAKDNAQYGFVYSSINAGKSWQPALEDKNSTWVSEESCAFGVHGVAYFVTDASKVDDKGMLHHEDGTTRIYVTHDSGRTWKEAIKTGWTDYSSSVVDTAVGPNQNRLYVFFNNLWTFYHALGDQKALDQLPKGGNSVGLISYKDGDKQIAGPITNPDMAAINYHGSYPAPSFLLKDGSLLTLFSSHFTTIEADGKKKREFIIASIRSDQQRTALEKPVTVVTDTPAPSHEEKCGLGLTSGGAYDAKRDVVYFAYPLDTGKSCQLMLTTSKDGGKNWTPAEAIHLANPDPASLYEMPALAVNNDGILGALWQEGPDHQSCWVFATSSDAGRSFRSSQKLDPCSTQARNMQPLANAYLWSVLFQPASDNDKGDAHIAIRYVRDGIWRDSHAVVATPDGAFRAVWMNSHANQGEIRTADLRLQAHAAVNDSHLAGLSPVSNTVSVLYGGTQHYDEASGMLTLAVTLRNNGTDPIAGPFRLEAVNLSSGYLDLQVSNAVNHTVGNGAIWDLSNSVPKDVLKPGEESQPYTLIFHCSPRDGQRSGDVLTLDARLYARRSAGSAAGQAVLSKGVNPPSRQ
jgi:hypothetical protein